jgi:hypothetical protein
MGPVTDCGSEAGAWMARQRDGTGLVMQYLLNSAQYPRPETPRSPILLEAPDDAAILVKARELVEQIRGAGAEKVQVQVRRAANLVLVGHVGDEA